MQAYEIWRIMCVEGYSAPRAGAYFDFECFLLKNGALYFITQQKKSFFSEIFNVVRLMDEKQTKYAPALTLRRIGRHTKLESANACKVLWFGFRS